MDAEPGPYRDDLPTEVADACLRVLGVGESDIERIRKASHELLDRYAGSQSATES